jgi:thioredoxin 1
MVYTMNLSYISYKIIIAFALLLLSAFNLKAQENKPAINKENVPAAKPNLKITEEDFWAKIKGSPLVIVEFGATWCEPCRKQAPIMDSVEKLKKGAFVLLKVDIDQNNELTHKMQVYEYPTLLLFKNGKQIWRGEGLMPAQMVLEVLSKN